ncbi:MAG TPA: hypothetical protein VMS17_21765 [Gemmataceae bacterium]|nr:hypothetical protein [Gemmataceae bacterium]
MPLRSVVLLDIQGLFGGQDIWIAEDGAAFAQVVEPVRGKGAWGFHVRRYRLHVPLNQITDLERLVATHDFLRLKNPTRPGVPDEASPMISLVTKAGDAFCVGKWANDKNSDFDPVYDLLLNLLKAEDKQLIEEQQGPIDWSWHPDGFPARQEVLQRCK